MKNLLPLITMLVIISTSSHSQLWDLKSEYDPDINDVCIRLGSTQWAIEYDMAKKNLADIYQLLNFSDYDIEVVECTKIRSSAIAYLDPTTLKRYILINPNRLKDIDELYFSHLFVIAHEFAHHKLNHFGRSISLDFSQKRELELDADRYASSIVKKSGGKIEDCLSALNLMNHPSIDTYYDHPTLKKRIAAVNEGFGIDVINDSKKKKNYTDYFQEFKDVSLLSYEQDVHSWDINEYSKQTGLVPRTICYFNNKYWIYWKKDPNLLNYQVCWNYNSYDPTFIQKYFDQGYNLNFIECINNKWFMVFCKYESVAYSQSTSVVNINDFINETKKYKDDIEKNLDEGYVIKDVIPYNSTGDLVVILDKKISDGGKWTWSFKNTYEDFNKWMVSMENQGYNYLYTFKIVNNQYFSFMTRSNSVLTWSVRSFNGDNSENITELLGKGYIIGNVTVDEMGINLTMVKY